MTKWVLFVASIFAVLGAGLRLQVTIREHAAAIERSSMKSLTWAAAASARALKLGGQRDLIDMKVSGAFLGLIGSLIVFILALIAVAI